jgi:hypothetical protein
MIVGGGQVRSFPIRAATALLAILCSHSALSQNLMNLPDAPVPAAQSAPVEAQGTAQVTGAVVDDQGYAVNAAAVTLSASGILGERSATSDADGRFAFTGLAPGQYRLIVNAQGFAAYTSDVLTVAAGQALVAPRIVLHITATTSIDVVATPDQIAVAQVHEEEKQRVFAVFPNFYTSYIWNAAPMPAREKYQMATRALIDPIQFLTVAGTAGGEQIVGTYSDYGPGIQGYGKRYAATMATATSSRMLGSAVFPALFHQDPRYFYQGSGGKRSRALHAFASTFVTRGDNGKDQPGFAHLLGSLSASAIASAYLPASDRSAGVVFQTFGIDVAGNIAENFFREFVLRGLVPSVPSFANGKRQASPSPQPSAPRALPRPSENPTPQR